MAKQQSNPILAPVFYKVKSSHKAMAHIICCNKEPIFTIVGMKSSAIPKLYALRTEGHYQYNEKIGKKISATAYLEIEHWNIKSTNVQLPDANLRVSDRLV